MTKRYICFVLFFLIFEVFFSFEVSSIGVSPGGTNVDYIPRLEKTVTFQVINTDGKDIHLDVATQGELARYITLENREISMSALETSKDVTYIIKLPEGLPPGLH